MTGIALILQCSVATVVVCFPHNIKYRHSITAQQVHNEFGPTHSKTVRKQSIHSTAGMTKQPYGQGAVGIYVLRDYGKYNTQQVITHCKLLCCPGFKCKLVGLSSPFSAPISCIFFLQSSH